MYRPDRVGKPGFTVQIYPNGTITSRFLPYNYDYIFPFEKDFDAQKATDFYQVKFF